MTDIVCVSPVDGREIARRKPASSAEIERAVAAARAAQKEWGALPLAERARYCSAAVDAMLAMGGEIAPEISWQMGRPIRYAAGELKGFEERARRMIAMAETALAPFVPEKRDGFRRMIKKEPRGVMLTVAPWNYPYLTAINSIIPGLLSGNAVILKHAAQTLLVGERFAEAFRRAGLPDGVFQTLSLDHDSTLKLISSGLIDQINFTGSVEAGRAIERAAAGTFANVTLELGGKDPAYVRHDANLAHAIENLVDGAMFNSGQCCCGIERIYVHHDVYDRFVAGASDLARTYVLDDPLNEATTLGPMARASLAEIVRRQVGEAVERGAKTHVDAAAFSRDRAGSTYVAPQILTGVDHDMTVMVEETFGPVVGIMPVRSDEEAVRLMNDSKYGLTAAIWTSDADAAEKLGAEIETGTVFMNRCDYLDPDLAWTGVKETGRGVSLSPFAFDHLTRLKSYHLRTQI
ncbi:aldehyde dehydrogenase family protein [Terrarubrum flagellatum]|uniref:aldehyde dehydrogenase family protein n=1 Tax=Terrirubrum flagellatum TaxID=2895980 RepID=UPI0031453963